MSKPRRKASPEQIAAAVRRHRRWRIVLGLLVLLVAASSYCSHVKSPNNPRSLEGQHVIVHEVIDGDTIEIRTPAGELERVRLKGIDAPELARGGKPAGYFASESKRYLRDRIDARQVVLQFDGTDLRDRYGRLLAFVYLTENDNINMAMVQNGYAYVDRRFHSHLQSKLGQAEGEARRKERGLWKEVTPDQMPVWRQEWLKQRNALRGVESSD